MSLSLRNPHLVDHGLGEEWRTLSCAMAFHEVHIEECLRFVLTTELSLILQKLYEADIVGLTGPCPTPAVMHELACSILGACLVGHNT